MKRGWVLAVILVTVILLQGSAMAGPKPPKVLCIQWSSGLHMVLVTKATGAIAPLASGNTKFYSVNGEWSNPSASLVSLPCTGTGHMNGDIFHFAVNCVYDNGNDTSAIYFFEARWNVTTHTGTGGLYWAVSSAGFQPRIDYDSLTALDCRTLILDH
ncbi:MAG: hypothetical protein WHX93_13305 [bacterium]